MRLWHQSLIPYLDRQRLLGAHRECCALRGKGWGKKHSVVDYVFTYPPEYLIAYHFLIMDEMKNRGYNPNTIWYNHKWRGNILGEQDCWARNCLVESILSKYEAGIYIFKEHNQEYLQECLDNLKSKGIIIERT